MLDILRAIGNRESPTGFADERALARALHLPHRKLRASLTDLESRGEIITFKPYFCPWQVRLAHLGHVRLAEAGEAAPGSVRPHADV